MFDIISKDALRKQIECASDNHVTVIYDNRGFPNLMCVIPRMTIGDCFTEGSGDGQLDSYLTDTHPAFQIYDSSGDYVKDVSEIFVGQYRSHIIYDDVSDYSTYSALSLPGYPSADNIFFDSSSGFYPIRKSIENKGTNWHLFNAWEFSAIQFWTYNNDIHIYGENLFGYDVNGKRSSTSSVSIKLSGFSGTWNEGDIVSGYTSGARGVINSVYYYLDRTTHIVIEIVDIYSREFSYGERIDNITSGGVGSVNFTSIIDINSFGGSRDIRSTHNHKFYGICDLTSFGCELIDGLRTRRINSGGEDYYMFVLTNGNYYQWNESLLEAHPAKFCLSGTNVLQLGYQEIDSNGNPTGSILDINLTSGEKWTMNILESTQNYIDYAGVDTRKKLTLLGIDQFELEDSEKVAEYMKNCTIIDQKSEDQDDTLFLKAQNAYEYVCTYTDMRPNIFRGYSPSSPVTANKYKSRCVYIPS